MQQINESVIRCTEGVGVINAAPFTCQSSPGGSGGFTCMYTMCSLVHCVCVSMCVHYTPVPGFIGSCSSLEPVCSELNYHHTALMYRRDEAYICHRIALLTRVHFIVKSCTDSETLTHYVNWRKD